MMPLRHRSPVSCYEQAVLWLIQHAEPEDWLWEPAASLPVVAHFVCDCYWVTEKQLIADMRREWDALMGVPARRKARRYLGASQ